MARYEKRAYLREMMISDRIRFNALVTAVIRFEVEKYGGTMHTSPVTGETILTVPIWAEDVCFQELATLVAPGNPFSGCMEIQRE